MAQRIVLASSNVGKLQEFRELFSGLPLEVIPQSQFKIPEVEETGLTFVENAILKARQAAKISGLPAIGDDSGLEVDAIQGAPGIYSARFAGAQATDKTNIEKLLRELEGITERTARFQCILVYLAHAEDPTPLIAQGIWEGQILTKPQGSKGFGYDPLFFVPNHQCSAAELPAEEKNRISHRGQALQKLLQLWHYTTRHPGATAA